MKEYRIHFPYKFVTKNTVSIKIINETMVFETVPLTK